MVLHLCLPEVVGLARERGFSQTQHDWSAEVDKGVTQGLKHFCKFRPLQRSEMYIPGYPRADGGPGPCRPSVAINSISTKLTSSPSVRRGRLGGGPRFAIPTENHGYEVVRGQSEAGAPVATGGWNRGLVYC